MGMYNNTIAMKNLNSDFEWLTIVRFNSDLYGILMTSCIGDSFSLLQHLHSQLRCQFTVIIWYC